MARKSGLGPQGRRTIDEARAGDGPSKGAFSEIPGRVKSGQTKPVDTIPGYVTASERPTPARGGLLGGTLGRGGPGGRLLPDGTRYTGPVNPNETISFGRPPSSSSSSSSMRSGTVSGNTPSSANAGPGRSAPAGGGGGGGGGNPVISGTSTPGNGGQKAAWLNKIAPHLDAAVEFGKAMLTPTPYAAMTWMERNLSPEGLTMLYGPGTQTAPLYGYQTSRYHYEPRDIDPSKHFYSSRHDPTIPDPEAPKERRNDGYPTDSGIPSFQQGGQTTAAQRLHRDPLHENVTQNLWGTPHEAAMGNLGGDVHTRTTRGFGDPTPSGRVESIRAPKPE